MYVVNFAARLTTMQPTGMKMSSLLSALAPNEVKKLKAEIERLNAELNYSADFANKQTTEIERLKGLIAQCRANAHSTLISTGQGE